jgi:hypothetical protein
MHEEKLLVSTQSSLLVLDIGSLVIEKEIKLGHLVKVVKIDHEHVILLIENKN